MILLTLLLGSCLARELPLREILRSPQETLKAYTQYKAAQHLHYGPREDRLRLKLWRSSAELVAEENSRAGRTADLTLNFFAAMSEDEMKQWRGMSVSHVSQAHLVNRLKIRHVYFDQSMDLEK